METIFVKIEQLDSANLIAKKIEKSIPLGYKQGNVQQTCYNPQSFGYIWYIEIKRLMDGKQYLLF